VITTKPPSPQHQQPEQPSRLSLAQFVSQFEEGKSFNETDLGSLGLNLNYSGPFLPMLHSVLSSAPLLTVSCHPIPDYYLKCPSIGSMEDKQSLFTDQTLMFIFHTETGTPFQRMAAEELFRRGFQLDEYTGKWYTKNQNEWSIDEWRELEPPEETFTG
jgi:hypothetical protein